MKQAIDCRELRRVLGAFPTGVTIATTVGKDGAPRGFTANSFTSVSLDPPLVLVCLAKAASSYATFLGAEGYAVNILAADQRAISSRFATAGEDKFEGVAWRPGETGCPLIEGAAGWIDCVRHQAIDAGDHVVLIGRVVGFDGTPAAPLGYCRGAYLTFDLVREAMPAPGQRVRVGAIIESDGRLLLVPGARPGSLDVPSDASLGKPGSRRGLYAKLAALGVEAELTFIFAVYEDEERDAHCVYYRGEARRGGMPREGAYLAFEAVPWERIADAAVGSMLRRYIAEREEDTFGVYVGGRATGTVERLARAGRRD